MHARPAQIRQLTVVFAVLSAGFVLAPFFSPFGGVIDGIRMVIEMVLVVAVWRLGLGRVLLGIVTAAVVMNEATVWLAPAYPAPWLIATNLTFNCVFLGIIVGFLLWLFWKQAVAAPGALMGAVGVYLLLGHFWASTFVVLEYLHPESFAGVCAPRPDGTAGCTVEIGRYPRLSYLSFVTMTTLGYGDVVPLSRVAEGLTVMAAVSGQLFIAILLGRMVGLYVHPETEERDGSR